LNHLISIKRLERWQGSEKDWLLHWWTQLPQSQSGHGGEGKNSQPLPGLKPPIIQPIAQHYPTELYWRQENYVNKLLIIQ
jgi:hypothetical protein